MLQAHQCLSNGILDFDLVSLKGNNFLMRGSGAWTSPSDGILSQLPLQVESVVCFVGIEGSGAEDVVEPLVAIALCGAVL